MLNSFGCSFRYVSIHAPGRGATRATQGNIIFSREFQFTHPGGVRLQSRKPIAKSFKFQFTHPGGVRQDFIIFELTQIKFQFTHPGGVRRESSAHLWGFSLFQFTHPGGVRPMAMASSSELSSFNSRTREGCDPRPDK